MNKNSTIALHLVVIHFFLLFSSQNLIAQACTADFDLVQNQPGILFFDCNYDSDEPRLWLRLSNFSGPDAPYSVSVGGGELSSTLVNQGDTVDYYITQADIDNSLASILVDNGSCMCTPYDSVNVALAGFPIAQICFAPFQCNSDIVATYPVNADQEPEITCGANGTTLELEIFSVTGGTGLYSISAQGGLAPSVLSAGQGFTYSLTQADIDAGNAILTIDDGNGCSETIDLNGYLRTAVISDICGRCAAPVEPLVPLPIGVCDGVLYQHCIDFLPSAEGITATLTSDLGYSDTQLGTVGNTQICFDVTPANSTCAVITESFEITANCDSLGYVTCFSGPGTTANIFLANGTELTDYPIGSVDIYPDPTVYSGYVVIDGTCSSSPTLDVSGSTCPPNFVVNVITATMDGCDANNNPNPSDGVYEIIVSDPLPASPCAFNNVTMPAIDVACPALALTATSNDPLCNGVDDGTASVSAAGGNGGYTYSWSNGASTTSISNLAPGTYIATVTDANGCSMQETVVINNPPTAIAISMTKVDPACNNITVGSATASATGGMGAFTYSWSNGAGSATANNLAPGTYTVTATDANGCQETSSITIASPPPAIAVSFASTDPLCNGIDDGTATASASGGTGTLTYAWANGASTATVVNLAPGVHNLTVTDANGCQVMTSVTIANPPAALNISSSSTDPICAGVNDGQASTTVTGGSGGYTYTWSHGPTSASVTNLSPGNYSVTVSDSNGCLDTEPITINPPANVLAAAGQVQNPSVLGAGDGSIAVTTTGPAVVSYSWSNGGTTASIFNLTPGTYTVTIVDVNGCTTLYSATVIPGPELPVAAATFTPNNAVAPVNVSFNASGSADPDGTIVSYDWDFGDGNMGTGVSPTHNYANPGVYTATLIVTDSQGLTDTITLSVNVIDTCNPPTNLILNSANPAALIVSWTGDPDAISYVLRYRDAAIGGAWNNYTTTGTTAIITGLNSCTDYEFKVSNQCTFNLQSGFSPIEVFSTTNCFVCTAPVGLYQFNIQNISAIITWDVLVGATSYTYKFRKVGDANWNSYTTTFPIAVLFGISGCTDYEWTMETTCYDGSTAQSSTINNFTTQCKDDNDENYSILSGFSEGLVVYPNPAHSNISIELPEMDIEQNSFLQVFDMRGALVLQKELYSGDKVLDLDIQDLENGVYVIQAAGSSKVFVKE